MTADLKNLTLSETPKNLEENIQCVTKHVDALQELLMTINNFDESFSVLSVTLDKWHAPQIHLNYKTFLLFAIKIGVKPTVEKAPNTPYMLTFDYDGCAYICVISSREACNCGVKFVEE